jgi:hypothetical protein
MQLRADSQYLFWEEDVSGKHIQNPRAKIEHSPEQLERVTPIIAAFPVG